MRHRRALHLRAVSFALALPLILWLWGYGADDAGSQASAPAVLSLRSVPEG
jgi:hypothetical protein